MTIQLDVCVIGIVDVPSGNLLPGITHLNQPRLGIEWNIIGYHGYKCIYMIIYVSLHVCQQLD